MDDADKVRSYLRIERALIYNQAGQWLATANVNGQRDRGMEAAVEFARLCLRNVGATYAECDNARHVERVLGMEQTLLQVMAITHDALVVPEVDESTLFVPILGQKGERS